MYYIFIIQIKNEMKLYHKLQIYQMTSYTDNVFKLNCIYKCLLRKYIKWIILSCYYFNLLIDIKGILHPKIKMLSFFTYPHVVPNPQKFR